MKTKSIRIAIVAIFVLTQHSSSAVAQIKENSAHVGLIYPLSNHWLQAKEYSNVFSLHALAGVSKNEKAISIAGVANIIKGEAKGAQMAGFLNKYKNGKGLQLAGFANVANGEVKGLQMAGFINKAGRVHGVQFAGFMNIADSSDYPIGFLNLIKDGSIAVGVSFDDEQTTLVSFRSGARVMYGLLGLGYNFQSKEGKYAFEAGIGAHLLTRNLFTLNMEISNVVLTEFKKPIYSKSSIRLLPAYRFSKNMEFYAGPTISHIFTNTPEGKKLVKHEIWKKSLKEDEMNAVNVGLIGGVQLYF